VEARPIGRASWVLGRRSNDPRAMAVDHEFGAQHTELKLSIVEGYASKVG
jgi:hypothetical protein